MCGHKKLCIQKPNSCTYNFVEFLGIILRVLRFQVFVHNVYIANLCSKGGIVKSLIRGDKEENSSDFCLDFVLEFGLRRFVEKDQIFLNYS